MARRVQVLQSMAIHHYMAIGSIVLGATLGCGGSDKRAEGPAEEAGESADEAAEDTKEAAEDAAEETGEAAEKAGDKVEDATKDED